MKSFNKHLCWTILFSVLCLFIKGTYADEILVAVAANFGGAIDRLSPDFTHLSGHTVKVSIGATGKLYAQIKNGAPFDLLLSADEETPLRLEQEKLGVAGARFTYAVGRLVLWSAQPRLINGTSMVLTQRHFNHLALANPATAPYGAAAMQVLQTLGLAEVLSSQWVQGENIAQTFQFVESGNADLGFVALSQVRALSPDKMGSQWLVPESLHKPLRQDAIVLTRAANSAAVKAFVSYLHSPSALAIMASLGYSN